MKIVFINQTRKLSLIESLSNAITGFALAMATQYFIFPYFDIYISIESNFKITFIFALVSMIRGYLIRRFFNYINCK